MFRILICSGDGSVGWVLSEIDRFNMHKQCQVAVMPLGTGNDLARVLGWGSSCDDDTHLPQILERYESASTKMLDRWSIMVFEKAIAVPKGPKMSITTEQETLLTNMVTSTNHHLRLIVETNDTQTLISSTQTLCETIDDLVTRISEYRKDDEQLSIKCDILKEKLSMLMDALQEEEMGAHTGDDLIATIRNLIERSVPDPPDTRSSFLNPNIAIQKTVKEELNTKERRSSRHLRTREKEALQCRANSIKRAIYNVIEHSEPGRPKRYQRKLSITPFEAFKLPTTNSEDSTPCGSPLPKIPPINIISPTMETSRLTCISPLPDTRRDSTDESFFNSISLPAPRQFADSRRSSGVDVIQEIEESATGETVYRRARVSLSGATIIPEDRNRLSSGTDTPTDSKVDFLKVPTVSVEPIVDPLSDYRPIEVFERTLYMTRALDKERENEKMIGIEEKEVRKRTEKMVAHTCNLQVPGICVVPTSQNVYTSASLTIIDTDAQTNTEHSSSEEIGGEASDVLSAISNEECSVASDIFDKQDVGQTLGDIIQLASAELMLTVEAVPVDVALVQKPWIASGNKVSGLRSPNYNTYYMTTVSRVRKAILVRKGIYAYLLSNYSTDDLTAERIQYSWLPATWSTTPTPHHVSSEAWLRRQKTLIIGSDANTHYTVWGKKDVNERETSDETEAIPGESILDDISSVLGQDMTYALQDSTLTDDTTTLCSEQARPPKPPRKKSLSALNHGHTHLRSRTSLPFPILARMDSDDNPQQFGFENIVFEIDNRCDDQKMREPPRFCSLAQFVEGNDIARQSFKRAKKRTSLKPTTTNALMFQQQLMLESPNQNDDPRKLLSQSTQQQSKDNIFDDPFPDPEPDPDAQQTPTNSLAHFLPTTIEDELSTQSAIKIEIQDGDSTMRNTTNNSLSSSPNCNIKANPILTTSSTPTKKTGHGQDVKRITFDESYLTNGGGFISKCLLANADTLCAAVSPLMDPDETLLAGYHEKCVMNNYFGIGIDAKISLDFHNKREEHPEKCRSRARNYMWYGVLGSKQLLQKTCKNLEQRVQLECDGQRIPLPELQGIVILNIPSFMGGTNFWGSSRRDDIFLPPSFDDRVLEVVAVFGSVQMAASRLINLQHHRIAQCQSVQINILGDEEIPIQVDGEAWLQPPGMIRILHKNRVQMLCRNRSLELSLKTWQEKQRQHSISIQRDSSSTTSEHASSTDDVISERECYILLNFIEAVSSLVKWVKFLIISHPVLQHDLYAVACRASEALESIHPQGKLLEGPSLRTKLVEVIDSSRQLYDDACNLLRDRGNSLILREDLETKLSAALANMEMELKKCSVQKCIDGKLRAYFNVLAPNEETDGRRKSRPFWVRLRSGSTAGQQAFKPPLTNTREAANNWSVNEVVTWLETMQLSEYVDSFLKNDIRGKELLALGRRDLKDLGVIKVGHVKRILQAIKDLSES
ncbi:hypothetical protein KR018_004265 [Drosophila ironensis]|nr:hypothetical protein KR018_004265 [Drosophila ironensis]